MFRLVHPMGGRTFVPTLSGGGAAFSPLNISGLKLWLKSDAGLYQERTGASATTPAASDTDSVGSWLDQSGSGNHATAAADGNRPILKLAQFNSRSVVRFDGTDDYLSLGAMAVASGSKSVFFVGKPPTGGAGKYLIDSQSGRLIIAFDCGTGGMSDVGWYDGTWHEMGLSTNVNQVLEWILTSGGNGEVFRNAVSLDTDPYSAQAIGTATNIGAAYDGAGAFGAFDMGELLMYDSAITGTNLTNLRAYLTGRWALP